MTELYSKYIDEIRGNMGQFRMFKSNLSNFVTQSRNYTATLSAEGQNFDIQRTAVLRLIEALKLELTDQKRQLNQGTTNAGQLLKVISKPTTAQGENLSSFFPTGFNLTDTTLFVDLASYLYSDDNEDIDTAVRLMKSLVLENTLVDRSIKFFKETPKIGRNTAHTVSVQFNKEMNSGDSDRFESIFRSILHWPAYTSNQLGIGGPVDLAKMFNKIFSEGNNKRGEAISDDIYKHSYLELLLLGVSYLHEKKGDTFQSLKRDIRNKMSILDNQIPETFYMNHETWFNNGTEDDSYVYVKENVPKLSGNGTAGGGLGNNSTSTWADAQTSTNTGLYVFAQNDYVAKLQPAAAAAAGCADDNIKFAKVYMFMQTAYLETQIRSIINPVTSFNQVFYNLPTTPGVAPCTGGNPGQVAVPGGMTQLPATPSIFQDAPFPSNTAIVAASTIMKSQQAGGKKLKSMHGGQGVIQYHGFQQQPRVQAAASAAAGAITLNQNLVNFTHSFLYPDRKLFDDKTNNNIIENMKRLWKEFQERNEVTFNTRITASFGKMTTTIPVCDTKDSHGSLRNGNAAVAGIGGNFGGLLSFDEYRDIILVANLSLNLGFMLKRFLYLVIIQYYNCVHQVIEKTQEIKNGANSDRPSTKQTRLLLDKLWEILSNKYTKITNLINQVFGTIPRDNDTNDRTLVEYFCGISFTLPGGAPYNQTQYRDHVLLLVGILDEYFPFSWTKDPAGRYGNLKQDITERNLVKLLYNLPDLYENIFTNVANAAANNCYSENLTAAVLAAPAAAGADTLSIARDIFALGGLPYFSINQSELQAFSNIIRFTIDSAKKSKETYINKCDILKENIESQQSPGEIMTIEKGVSEYMNKKLSHFDIATLLERQKISPDNTKKVLENELVRTTFDKFIREILIDLCKKKNNFRAEYMRNTNQNIANVESRIGSLELSKSIYQMKAPRGQARVQRLNRIRNQIKIEARAVLKLLKKGYILGYIPHIYVRYGAEKMHNIIFDLDNFTTRILGMDVEKRRSVLNELGYTSHNTSNSEYKLCLTQDLIPNNYNTTDFWKGKESIFNHMTRRTFKFDGTTEYLYQRIYIPVVQKIDSMEKPNKENTKKVKGKYTPQWTHGWEKKGDIYVKKKGITYKLWMVDLFTLVHRSFDTLSEEKGEKIQLDPNTGKVKGDMHNWWNQSAAAAVNTSTILQKDWWPKRRVWNATEVDSSFGLESFKSTEAYIQPLVLLGSQRMANKTRNAFADHKTEDVTADFVVIVTDQHNVPLYDKKSVRQECYKALFYLPTDPFIPSHKSMPKIESDEVIKTASQYLSPVSSKLSFLDWDPSAGRKFLEWAKGMVTLGIRGSKLNPLDAFRKVIRTYEIKITKQFPINAFLVNILTNGPQKTPMPFHAGVKKLSNMFKTFGAEQYLKNILNSYNNPTNLNIDPKIKTIDILGKMKGTSFLSNSVALKANEIQSQKNRVNVRYVTLENKTQISVSINTISVEEVQKALGWIEDIQSVSELKPQHPI